MTKVFVVGIIVIVFGAIGTLLFMYTDQSAEEQQVAGSQSLTNPSNSQPANSTPTADATLNPVGDNATELKIEDLKVGSGTEAVSGKKITVNYRGTLTDGTEFDSSYDKSPFTFTLGAGDVIEGWDKGFDGMKVGGKRKLTIPPEMGYGAQAVGKIPANSTLVFEVELLKVE